MNSRARNPKLNEPRDKFVMLNGAGPERSVSI